MYCRWLIVLFLSIIFAVKTHAETFTVTSNADSGPGTLRDALTKAAANGAAEKDFIYFNLPDVSEAGRTIALIDFLPDMTANIEISGLTQAGLAFGISQAKVKILLPYGLIDNMPNGYNILRGNNINDITIAGLWLVIDYPEFGGSRTINIVNANDVTIVKNIIQNGKTHVEKANNFIFQNNISGFLPDGITGSKGFDHIVEPVDVKNSLIGGSPTTGNLVSCTIRLDNYTMIGPWSYNISYNLVGVDYTGRSSSPAIFTNNRRISASMEYYRENPSQLGEVTGIMRGNVTGSSSSLIMYASGRGTVIIEDNYIGTDRTGEVDLRDFFPDYAKEVQSSPTALLVESSIRAQIRNNIIAYASTGIAEQMAGEVVIKSNQIYCIGTNYVHVFRGKSPSVVIKITSLTSNTVTGTATPNARVQLFRNNMGDCTTCGASGPYITVTADAQGNWSAPNTYSANISAAAILNNQTSLFTIPEIDVTNLNATPIDCNGIGGDLTGAKFYNTGLIKWVNEKGEVVSNSVDAHNLPQGKYMLIAGAGNCSQQSNWIEVIDYRPNINTENIIINNPGCNQLGSVKGITAIGQTNEILDIAWYDKNNLKIASSLDISNLVTGEYNLVVTGKTHGCVSKFGPVYLQNSNSVNINIAAKTITQTACNQATGSIRGITATGTGALTYSWRNAQDIEVGNTADLTNQPAGFYKLKVTDESACGPVYSEPIEITAINGVKLVTSNVSVRSSTCGLANGYIRGLQAPGATTFIWTRDDGSVAGNTLDLENIPAGNYRLTISNATCANYADFRIDAVTPTVYPQFAATITKTCAAFPTGTITINTDGAQDQPGIFRWVDSQNNTAGFGKTIQYLPAAAYKLYLTDAGSCESFYKEYVVDSYPELKVTFGNAHDIYCGVGKGSVDAAAVSGGTGNYSYEWKDGNGTVIPGKTQAFINDVDAGTYTLSITDGGCNLAMLTYTIKEQTQIIPAPLIADIEVTRTGNTTLQVTDPFPTAIYRLYDSESGLTPLAESQGGSFTVNVTGNRSYYIGLSYGECESPRTRVRVILTMLNVNIPNTFTPNGDGFNDYWTITGIEESKIATVKIFGRSGQMVFQSVGYPKPFDGTQNGRQLPASVYYYIIEQKNAKPISGYVTILR